MIKLPCELKKLFNELEDIKYAVFKEIDCLKDALYGEGDIDIVVDVNDFKKFEDILLKYKAIRRGSIDNEIMFYYLYVESINKVILIHLHKYLLVGSKIFKEILLPLPLDIEFFENTKVKILKSELLLLVAIIRSVYRKTLKEEYSYLEDLISKSNKEKFYVYVDNHLKSLKNDIIFPDNPKLILKQNLNLTTFAKYHRFLIVLIDVLNFKIRQKLSLPVVYFKKGLILRFKVNLTPFYRLEIKRTKSLFKSYIIKIFKGLVLYEGKNKEIKSSQFWQEIYQGINK